jgi:predicted metal-binding membrane protein
MSQLRAVAAGFGWRAPRAPVGARLVLGGVGVAVLAAWVAMVAMLAVTHRGAAGGGTAAMPGMPGMTVGGGSAATTTTTPTWADVGSGVALWALMVVAMMLPSALPAVRHVGAGSLRWRRRRAMTTFVIAYVAVWVAAGVGLVLLLAPLRGFDTDLVAAGALAVAAAWQLTGFKRRALSDCHRPSPLPPRGWRATAGVLRFAARNGLACVRSCWALMLAMTLARSMPVFWMVAITGIVTVEKFAAKPRQAVRVAAVLLAVGAFLTGLSALTP